MKCSTNVYRCSTLPKLKTVNNDIFYFRCLCLLGITPNINLILNKCYM